MKIAGVVKGKQKWAKQYAAN